MNLVYLESSPNWGGQELSICLEIKWANENGHKAWLLCDPDSDVRIHAEELRVPFRTLKMRRRISPWASAQLWRFCRQNRIEVINANSSKDHWIALPLYLGGFPLTRCRSITDPVGGPNRAWIYRHGCSRIITVAKLIKLQMMRDNGIDPGKIEVVGNAVDLVKFRPDQDGSPFRRELGIDARVPLIANVGMIRPDKGQELLIDAAEIVLRRQPETRFALIGKGTGNRKLERDLKARIVERGLAERILMVGHRWDTPTILAAADLVVVASQRTESSSLVIREALAMRKPLVTTNVGDVSEVLQHGQTAWIVPTGSASAIADGLLELLTQPDLALSIARNGHDLAKAKFGYAAAATRKFAVYASIIRARVGRPTVA